MKIITLEQAYADSVGGVLDGCKRIHPHIDVGNGQGPSPMPEISKELNSGDWYDVGYCHNQADAAILAHCFNVLPGVLAALKKAAKVIDSEYPQHQHTEYGLPEIEAVIANAESVKVGT